jgi:hypothetical protein
MKIRWQDWINLAIGLWLVISPSLLGFGNTAVVASLFTFILGLAVVLFAALALFKAETRDEAVLLMVAASLIAGPWLLGFHQDLRATINVVAAGLAIIGLSVSAMLIDAAVRHWLQDHHLLHR